MRAKAYCEGTDVIVPLGANDVLLGRQTFKVINALYHDKQNWIVLFRALQSKDGKFFADLHTVNKVEELRHKGINTDSFLATYRP